MPANPIGLALRSRRAGQHTLVWARADLRAPENFTLTSPAFGHGAPIPEKYRGRLLRANISPALDWTRFSARFPARQFACWPRFCASHSPGCSSGRQRSISLPTCSGGCSSRMLD